MFLVVSLTSMMISVNNHFSLLRENLTYLNRFGIFGGLCFSKIVVVSLKDVGKATIVGYFMSEISRYLFNM